MEENASLDGHLGTAVAAEELLLALPKTRESPYENDWIEITDEELLRDSTIRDYNVLAFKHIEVKVIQAHTLAEENSSVKVLQKCGFKFIGDTIDKEEGPIWKWLKEKQI